MQRLLLIVAALLALGACRVNDSAQHPAQADAAPASAQQAGQAAAAAPGQAASGKGSQKGVPMVGAVASDRARPETQKVKPPTLACATDSDCYAISNYCGGCHCEVANAQEERKCKDGNRVACFADPCLDKRTRCQQGRCELVDRKPER